MDFPTLFAALMGAHMIADYPLQIDWMAENKHSSKVALLSHSAVHGIVAGLLVSLYSIELGVFLSLFVVAIHSIIDAAELHIRWDQTLHFVSIIALSLVVYL